MENLTRRQHILLLFILSVIALLFMECSSCSKEKKHSFSDELSSIDQQLSLNSQDAKNSLNALVAYATSPQDFLSIAKRQYGMKDLFATIKTLDQGCVRFSTNAELVAFLTTVLIESGRYEDACNSAQKLESTPYTAIVAEASMRADVQNSANKTTPDLWLAAYQATKIQGFLINTAIMYALKGELQKAFKLRKKIDKNVAPQHPYFWTCLSFDLGFFDTIFQDLPYSLDIALKTQNHNPLAKNYAQKHMLLAADAAYGSGDVERARAFWQDYIDRFDEIPPHIMYNMAKTAPDKKEQVSELLHCLEVSPNYYPVAAEYIRLCMAARNNTAPDYLETLLADKKAFSLSMEEKIYASPDFILTPEAVLAKAKATGANDPRFKLELFRYNEELEADFIRNSAAMWKLLEDYPHDAYVREYARWFFALNQDFDAALEVGNIADVAQKAFYAGVKASLNGETESALANFFEAQKHRYTRVAALVNSARIYTELDNNPAAVESYLAAAKSSDNLIERSYFEYSAARILADHNALDEAIIQLHSAIDHNPDNYLAQTLLKHINQSK